MPLTPEANLNLLVAGGGVAWALEMTYSTSSSAWTLAMPCTRAIPSLQVAVSYKTIDFGKRGGVAPALRSRGGLPPNGVLICTNWREAIVQTYPTDRTRPVSARLDSSWTPRMRCSRMEETSVGVAFSA